MIVLVSTVLIYYVLDFDKFSYTINVDVHNEHSWAISIKIYLDIVLATGAPKGSTGGKKF